jgi:hypothetical protein
MRFGLISLILLLSVGALAERSNPKVEAMLSEAEARLSEDALARYAAPGDAARYEALLRAMRESPDEIGSPSEDVYTPIQVHENGETKLALQSAQGWMSDDLMRLRGKEVKIFSYAEDGSLESTISAYEILVDRHTMLAVMRGKVSIEMGVDTLEGNGALMDFNAQYIRLLRQAKATTSRLSEANANF